MKKILILAAALATVNVFAADQCTSWGCVSTISELYTTVHGKVYVSTPFDENLANCTVNQGKYFTLDLSKPNGKEVYATLLAAYIAQEKIQLRIIENQLDCPIAYVRMNVAY